MAEARYQVRAHPRADDELASLRREFDVDGLVDRIWGAAEHRQPKTHRCVKAVEKYPDLLRVKGNRIRALTALEKPTLVVLVVGKRRGFYKHAPDTAMKRLREWRNAGGGA